MFKMKKMLIALCMSIVLLSQFGMSVLAAGNYVPAIDNDGGGGTVRGGGKCDLDMPDY
ncbi:hypothetical protein [Tissierella carlieri]|nr:hypothetical protein [Tissierella carlieri]